MAMLYPEGEVFFDRKVLNTKYSADDPKEFYSYFMVEYLWNVEAYHGDNQCKRESGGRTHPRSPYCMVSQAAGDSMDPRTGKIDSDKLIGHVFRTCGTQTWPRPMATGNGSRSAMGLAPTISKGDWNTIFAPAQTALWITNVALLQRCVSGEMRGP